MTNSELAKWILDNRHSPSGYPDGSVIWRVNLSDEKIAQIVHALEETEMWKERWEDERRDHEETLKHLDQAAHHE